MSPTGRIRERWVLSLGLCVLVSTFFAACGDDGESAACPPLSLYDIGNAGERQNPEVEAERAAAVDAGCMTPLMVDAGTD